MLLTSNGRLAFQSGFTLIEVIIAVAVIGILSTLAMSSYQIQVRKSQFTAIHQEINYFKVPYQILIDEGGGVTDFSPNGLNIPAQTKYCQFSVIAPNTNGATANAIVCQIQNLSYLESQSISLDLAADRSWTCRASLGIARAYLPQACR